MWREYARGDGAQQQALAKISVLAYQAQLQQQRQIQNLLTDARQQWTVEQQAQQQPAQIFAMADDNDGAGPTYYDD